MAIGDLRSVDAADGVRYVDVGTHGVPNYGSVYVVDAAEPAVVDAGTGRNHDLILGALDDLGIDPAAVRHLLLTHVHLDHAGGAGHLAAACPNATVRVHEAGVRHLVDPERLVEGTKRAVGDQWEFYADPEPVPEDRVEALSDGDTVDLGDRRLDVAEAPGHAPHQVVFFDDRDDVCFTADAAGLYVPSRDEVRETTPPPQFDLEAALDDARTIEGRDPDVLAFAHFGPREFDPSVTEGYRRTLVEWVEAVRQKRAELDDDEAVVEYFAENARDVEAWGERKAREEERLNARGVLAYLDGVAGDDG